MCHYKLKKIKAPLFLFWLLFVQFCFCGLSGSATRKEQWERISHASWRKNPAPHLRERWYSQHLWLSVLQLSIFFGLGQLLEIIKKHPHQSIRGEIPQEPSAFAAQSGTFTAGVDCLYLRTILLWAIRIDKKHGTEQSGIVSFSIAY